jgi:outer membrane protein assembly factor BamB
MRRIALCFALTAALTARADDWPQYGGPARNMVSAETAWTHEWNGGTPRTLWSRELGKGYASFAVAEGRVYTAGAAADGETYWCLDAATGDVVWQTSVPGRTDKNFPGPTATPAVADGRVFTVARDGRILCLKADDGSVAWTVDAVADHGVELGTWLSASSPLLAKGEIVADLGRLLALDPATGRLLWKAGASAAGYCSAVEFRHGGRRLVTSFSHDGLSVFDPARPASPAGDVHWSPLFRGRENGVNVALPIVDGDRIFISSGYDRGAALFRLTGEGLEKVYENTVLRAHLATPVLRDGFLYGFDGHSSGKDSALKCVEWATGRERWAETLKPGALLLAGDRLIVLADGGELLVVRASPERFEALARAPVLTAQCWTAPVLSGGRLYARNTPGQAVCVDLNPAP